MTFASELFIQWDRDSCCEHIAVGVNIYLLGSVGLLAPECVVCLCVCLCLFVCVISNQSTSKKLYHVSDLSKLDTLLHKKMHQGPEAQHLYIHDIIKKSSTSNVAQSPIQPKKEDNRMSSGGVGGKGVVNKGGLHKMIIAFCMCSSFHFLYQYEKRFYFILLGIN